MGSGRAAAWRWPRRCPARAPLTVWRTMRSAPRCLARQRSISMDCESVERVANDFSKVPFQPTFSSTRWQVARCYNVTYQVLVRLVKRRREIIPDQEADTMHTARCVAASPPAKVAATRARAAALISESIGIPLHLSHRSMPGAASIARPTTEGEKAMTKHMTGTREEWLAARLELLKAEKELTRRSDGLARRRQELPWIRIDKEYRFDTDEGSASLADLFQRRSQLLIYHFMFGPDYSSGCPSCSAIGDGFNGFGVHLANHDVMLWAVSRAPLEKLQAYKRRMGWSFPWASSFGSEFNSDFDVYASEEQQRTGAYEYNYQPGTPAAAFATRLTPDGPTKGAAMTGTDVATYVREKPGMSAFALEDGTVYHTYSAYARGLDGLWGAYQWLDRAPKGRNETAYWWRRHDEYDKP